jgi:hypothetical protein
MSNAGEIPESIEAFEHVAFVVSKLVSDLNLDNVR